MRETTELPVPDVSLESEKAAKDTRKPWDPLSFERYAEAWEDGVHFSFRYVNSQMPGGVRLAAGDTLDLPYLCVRTVGPDRVETDYINSNNAMRQIKAVQRGNVQKAYRDVPSEQVELIERVLAATQGYAEIECDMPPVRLRQVIVQKRDGTDLVLTPIVSSGLFNLLLSRLYPNEANSAADDTDVDVEVEDEEGRSEGVEEPAFAIRPRRVRRAFLNVGGSNPVNVGLMHLVRSMRRPLWFKVPEERVQVRTAIAIYHRGVSLQPSTKLLREFRQWRLRASRSDGAHLAINRIDGVNQLNKVREIVQPIVDRANAARCEIEAMAAFLPRVVVRALRVSDAKDEQVVAQVSPELPIHMRALLDRNMRYTGWKDQCAYQIYMALIGQQFRDGDDVTSLGVGEMDASGCWVDLIKGMLA